MREIARAAFLLLMSGMFLFVLYVFVVASIELWREDIGPAARRRRRREELERRQAIRAAEEQMDRLLALASEEYRERLRELDERHPIEPVN